MQAAPMAPPMRIDVGAVAGHRADVARGAGEAGDEQEVLVAADQRRHRLAAVEHEARRGGARPMSTLRWR